MTFAGIFNTLMLLGCLQGFIISCLLFFSKKRSRPNRLLGILILLIALACANMYLYQAPWFTEDSLLGFIFNFIPLVIIMPAGPLLYFYVKSSLDPDFTITKKQRAHFIPVIIDIVPQSTAAIFVTGVLTGMLPNKPQPWGIFIDNYNVYSDIPRWLSLTLYLRLSERYISGLKAGNEPLKKWMRQFTRLFLVFQVIWFIYLVPYVIPQYTDKLLNMVDWYPVYVPMVILIYWLGIKGYMMAPQEAAVIKTPAGPAPLPTDMIRETVPLLVKAMEQDQLYLDPNLNLSMLSQHTGIAQKTISAVLNQHLNKSFNEFVNGYRIATFKQKISGPQQDHLTIFGIAMESGFNSQATFQRAFKNSTGMSPREYMNRELKKTG